MILLRKTPIQKRIKTAYAKLFLLAFIAFALIQVQLVNAQSSSEVAMLAFDGPVTPIMHTYFERGLAEAAVSGADAVLITLNTPGGAVVTTLEIVELFRASEIPVIVYIGPEGAMAASAGSIITAAAHAAGMAPETIIGAASPINSDGSDINETAYRKEVEALKATIRSLTERRGPEAVALGEAMIEDARAVSSQEALTAGFIDAIADSPEDLLAALDGRTVLVNGQEQVLHTAVANQTAIPLTFIEMLLLALTNTVLVSILMAIGVQAIIIEISSPGGWVAGFIGVLFLGIGLYGLGQLPVNWLGLGLILVAFVLLGLEIKAPTHGALAIAGTITLIAGLLVLFNSGTPEFVRLSIPAAIAIALFTASFFVAILAFAVRAQGKQPITGQQGMLGQIGIARDSFDPDGNLYRGTITLEGEIWQATSSQPIHFGDEVKVRQMQGMKMQVEPVAETAVLEAPLA
ncbi:MAG: nodulation protein NfeD [Ardenticatenaceae bacterium]|nr:nodulation protein NfeD [Ardenticatenaceae bacterium]MCB8949351.1 nodulation protein NfeD [Ardenticatenaceae bacterium]